MLTDLPEASSLQVGLDAEGFAVNLRADETFQPFSNGYEYRMWTARNCERGKGCRNYRPNASTSRDGCPMEVGIALASCLDGQVKAKHGLRAGLLEPGPSGLLVRAEGDASTWRCPEYRDRDEPDDRRRRGPQPPVGQIDLLDPRTLPEQVAPKLTPTSTEAA